MIKKVVKVGTSPALLRQFVFSFSYKLTPQYEYPEEEKLSLADWREMMESNRKNVMKNYDLILPGVYIRNEFAFE